MSTIISDMVSHLQCGEALSARDAVYISNADGKIYKYSPLDPTQVFAGIAKEAGLLNAFIRVVQSGRVKGFTGLTPGAFVYASVTTPGGFQLTEPGSTLKVVLGIAKSATELTVNGALGIKTGGDGTGSGSLDTILQLTATEQFTDWSTGNNATVLGGGVLDGSFVKEATTPLHGSESYKYTQAAGSLNDYFLSKSFPVDIRFRGQQVYFSAPIQYNGNSGDIQIVIYDVTNATVLTTLSNSVIGTNGATQTVIASALLPLTCASIRVGFQVKVLNSGKVFQFDDIQLSNSLYQAAQLNNVTDWVPATFSTLVWQGLGTVTNNLQCRRNGPKLEMRGNFITGTTTPSIAQIPLPNNYGLITTTSITSGESLGSILRNTATNNILNAIASNGSSFFNVSNYVLSNSAVVAVNGNAAFTAGDAGILQNVSINIQGWSSGNTAIVTPTQQISSDTLPFTFKSTAIVDADPIGTFNTYTYASGGNVTTISGSAPTQTVTSMNTNGILVTARAFNANSVTATPAKFDIKIGKGLKADKVRAYANLAKSGMVKYDVTQPSSTVQQGTSIAYDEITGILTIDAGVNDANTTTTAVAGRTLTGTSTTVSAAYFVFNASTTPSIAALPILQPRIATLSDVKASGTAGGSAAAATTQTRVLNTLVDPTGIVTSLVSNQFTLPRGVYYIEASAPAAQVGGHKCRLRNISDTATSLIGSSGYSPAAASTTVSILNGEVTVTSAKTFELQHYTVGTKATDGLGVAVTSGESEIYSIVKITKVRDI